MLPLANTDEIVRKVAHRDPDEFGRLFGPAYDAVRGQILKLELRQEYRQPEKPYDKAIFEGRLSEARSYIPGIVEKSQPTYRMLAEKHVELIRCRPIKVPITDYTKWEVAVFRETQAFEKIYWCLYAQLDVVFEQHARHDFMVFDARMAVIHDYDDEGYFQGGWFVDAPEDILALISLFAFIKANSMSLETLQSPDLEF